MKRFLALQRFFAMLHARNLEFVRDRAALVWALMFPALMIIGCAIIFSGNSQRLLTIGYLGTDAAAAQSLMPGLPEGSIEWLAYEDLSLASTRVRYHQLDLLIDPRQQRYWVNPESARGKIAEQLLRANGHTGWQSQSIEGRAVRYVDWALPGILGMNMMFASLFGVGYVVVRYRMNGVLKRLRATPTNAFEFLSSQIVSRLILIMLASTLIFIGCDWLLDFLMLGSYLNLFLVGVLGSMAMISLGLVISSRTDSEEFAGGMLNLCTWPMMFLSEVWFSLDNAPAYVRTLAELLPLTHLVAAARSIMLEGAGLVAIQHHLLILAITTVVLTALASILFRWQRD